MAISAWLSGTTFQPPYNIMAGKKIKFFNPDLASEFTYEKQQITDAEKISTRPKKSWQFSC